jgi:GNAT superfamily N-acetyltransferase
MAIDRLDPIHLDARWISQALSLSDEAGWNQTKDDWRLFFRYGKVLGMVAGDCLVATAATLPYGDDFGWVSMVLVTSAWRRKGLATQLVRSCAAMLRSAGRAALLDAAPAAAGIYESLGFVSLTTMERWVGRGMGLTTPTTTFDFQLDGDAFGADRRFLLKDFLARPGSASFSTPSGFAILRQGRKTAQIGPVIAERDEAVPLLERAIAAAAGPVAIDVLNAGNPLLPWLRHQGFQRLRPFNRMALGISQPFGNPSRLLAAAGPEFG